MITLDTSAPYALLDRRDPDHAGVIEALQADPGPYVVPAGILAELRDTAARPTGASRSG